MSTPSSPPLGDGDDREDDVNEKSADRDQSVPDENSNDGKGSLQPEEPGEDEGLDKKPSSLIENDNSDGKTLSRDENHPSEYEDPGEGEEVGLDEIHSSLVENENCDGKTLSKDENHPSEYEDRGEGENFQVREGILDEIVDIASNPNGQSASHEPDEEGFDAHLIETPVPEANLMEIESIPPEDSVVLPLASPNNGMGAPALNDHSSNADNSDEELPKPLMTDQIMVVDEKGTIRNDSLDKTDPETSTKKAIGENLSPGNTFNETRNADRFYALRKGNTTASCIYLSYSDIAEQLKEFPDAQHAVFDNWKDAIAYIRMEPETPPTTSITAAISSTSSTTQAEKRKSTDEDTIDNPKKLKLDDIDRKTESVTTSSKPNPQSDVYVSVYNNSESWDEIYQKLKDFHGKNGHTDVAPGSLLGSWVARQRKEFQKFTVGSKSEMTQERVDKLQTLNFFFTSAKKALKFEQRIDELVKFKKENGNIDPPSTTLLYKWIYSMRKKYRDMKEGNPVSGLDQMKIQRLDEIGFLWTGVKENRKQQKQVDDQDQDTKPTAKRSPAQISKKEQRWNELFDQLKDYHKEHGHFTVTRHESTLGRWVSSQRLAYRKLKNGEICSPIFNEEKIQKLHDIGFDFECKRGRKSGVEDASAWDEMYDELKKFKEENGHCIPPTQPSTPLRRWVEKQRSEYKKIRAGEDSHLTLLRIQRLNDIGFSFEAKCKPKTWDERFNELVEFKKKFGHCKVPRLYNGLGKWVADQRQKYSKLNQGKKTNMTLEKAQKLTDLGMIWVVFKLPPKEDRAERKPWAERFQELLAFQNEHGHTVVPQHYPVLGHWVHTQRVHYKLMKQGRKSLMTPEQAFQLADIGFTFEVMPRKKSTIRQSLGNPYPHLPLIASADETPEVTDVARAFPRHQIGEVNSDQIKDENTTYHNTDEGMIYHNKDNDGQYQSNEDSTQFNKKDNGVAYNIGNAFDEYGI